jgi:hypothetical protein
MNQALGGAGAWRRPDPTIAALWCSSAWLIHGYNQGDAEIIFFSLYGWAAYMYCLTVFLKLCTVEEAINALAKVQVASYYLAAVIATGELTEFNRYLCAATGWSSASAQLLTFLFSVHALVENRPFDPGGKGLLSRAAIRDKQGAIKGRPFVAGRLRPAT